MAKEISFTSTLKFSKNGIVDSRSMSCQPDVAGSVTAGGVQKIGTTHEALVIGDIGTPGWARFLNIDAVNYVELGIVTGGTFYPFAKLKAGESFPLRLGTSAPYAKANTAEVKLEYLIIED